MKKYAEDLVIGDILKVGGVRCTITKVEFVFYYVPNSRVRLELKSDGYLGRGSDVVVFFSRGAKVKVSK